jgi:predicted RNA-binding Zn-ribbon protein involved in translation (DUF1610 family)
MSTETTAQAKFGCPACGRQFSWRPEIAGKRAKCKCGAAVPVPAESPAAAAPKQAPEVDHDDPFAALAALSEPGAESSEDNGGYRCPSCRQSMEPGSVMCVHCGFNTRTGKRMNTKVGGGGDDAPAKGTRFPAGGIAKPKDAQSAGASAMLKPALLVVALVLVVGGAIFGFKMLSGGGAGGAPTHEIDRQVTDLIDQYGRQELKTWLAPNERAQRMLMGMNERQGVAFADRLYTRGAKQVLAFGGMMSTVVGVELPADAAQRTELFKYQAEWHESMFVPVQKDEGQKFMLLQMKLVK